MNILTDCFPEAVEVEGIVYEVNADFRTGIEIMLAFEDPQMTVREKMSVMVNLLYKTVPSNLQKACKVAVKFLNCGEEQQPESVDGADRLYSFEHDAKYIYSAIKQTHGIDLEREESLHWWKFSYMFLDLQEDCLFNQIMQLRRKKLQGALAKEERKHWAENASILELPQYNTLEEQEVEDEFMRLLQQNG